MSAPDVSRILSLIEYATPEEKAEIDKILESTAFYHRDNPPSFADFLRLYVWTDQNGRTKFDPYPWQLELAEFLPYRENVVLSIICKARQIGATWFFGALAVWDTLFFRGNQDLVLSQNEDEAKEFLKRAKFVYENLPEPLKPRRVEQNLQMLSFPLNHSRVQAMPSTEKAGRGRTARRVMSDEYATHPYAENNMTAVLPAMEHGGQCHFFSSPQGVGNQFFKLWVKSKKERKNYPPFITPERREDGQLSFGNQLDGLHVPFGEWLPIFLPYTARPGRDDTWWENTSGSFSRMWMMYQEYPRTEDEAFVQSGRNVFDPKYIRIHEERCKKPLPQEEWPRELLDPVCVTQDGYTCEPINPAYWKKGELKVFAKPDPNKLYIAGVDVAQGIETGDYDSLVILDRYTMEEVLTLHGKWPPDVFGELVDRLARTYRGRYGVERAVHGHAVLLVLKQRMTPGIFRSRQLYGKAGQVIEPGHLGWDTNRITKPLMIDELEEGLRKFEVHIFDERHIEELSFYQTKEDGSTGAPEGGYDDQVVSLAIAVQMGKYVSQEPDHSSTKSESVDTEKKTTKIERFSRF